MSKRVIQLHLTVDAWQFSTKMQRKKNACRVKWEELLLVEVSHSKLMWSAIVENKLCSVIDFSQTNSTVHSPGSSALLVAGCGAIRMMMMMMRASLDSRREKSRCCAKVTTDAVFVALALSSIDLNRANSPPSVGRVAENSVHESRSFAGKHAIVNPIFSLFSVGHSILFLLSILLFYFVGLL